MHPDNMADFMRKFMESDPAPDSHSDMALLLATIHHLWMDHSLKIERSIGLLPVTDDLAIDFADIQFIRKNSDGDYLIQFKSLDNELLIYETTPEYVALQACIKGMLIPKEEH